MKLDGAVSKVFHISEALPVPVNVAGIWRSLKSKASAVFPLLFLFTFAAGILSGAVSDRLSNVVNRSADAFIDGDGRCPAGQLDCLDHPDSDSPGLADFAGHAGRAGRKQAAE